MYNNNSPTSHLPSAPIHQPEAISPSRIRDGITRAEEILIAVHEAIGALELRLDTILQPQPPQAVSNAANSGKPSDPQCSRVMFRIDILNKGFDDATNRLRDMARRIEV